MNLMMQEQIVNGAFGISPATVYGFLVGLLVVALIVMSLVIRYLYKKIEKLTSELTGVYTENAAALTKLSEMIDDYHDPDKRRVRHADHLNYLDHKFETIKDLIKK